MDSKITAQLLTSGRILHNFKQMKIPTEEEMPKLKRFF